MPLLLGPLKMDVIVNVSFLTALGYALYFIGLEVGCSLTPLYHSRRFQFAYYTFGVVIAAGRWVSLTGNVFQALEPWSL